MAITQKAQEKINKLCLFKVKLFCASNHKINKVKNTTQKIGENINLTMDFYQK